MHDQIYIVLDVLPDLDGEEDSKASDQGKGKWKKDGQDLAPLDVFEIGRSKSHWDSVPFLYGFLL
jgi:hypothetical protein